MTNRALLAAALASGTSRLTGALAADDTDAMRAALGTLGVAVRDGAGPGEVEVVGCGGRLDPGPAHLDARLSGTTARFLLPVLALGTGSYTLDGAAPLRARPMRAGVDALRRAGVAITESGTPGHLPVEVTARAWAGGELDVDGEVSSQFLSGLLLAGAATRDGARITLRGTKLVSRPYVALTRAVMAAFGASVTIDDDVYTVAPGYHAADYAIEPDATAASYPLAAAAICGGRVRVRGLRRDSVQGDVAFVDVLARMGAEVSWGDDGVEVTGPDRLTGIEVDLGAISDTAQTLAAVAVFAAGPTQVSGIGFIRRKETDRIAAIVTELRRCGIEASETDDGFVVRPGTPAPARLRTYDDHRMAMSLSLLGLRVPGMVIEDPDVVAKTFPGYFMLLERLVA